MKVFLFFLGLFFGPFANAEQLVREVQVPEKFVLAVQEEGLFDLGDIIHFTAKIQSLNDNILHGVAMGTGVTHFPNEVDRNTLEGDDRSLTFKGKLVTEWGFERGSMALELFTANYSRLAYQRDEYGIPRYRNHSNNKVYTEHLIHNEAKVNFVRDLSGQYFMRITGSYATLDDHGLGFDIQDFWHSQHLENVEYDALEHFEKQKLYTSNLGLGRRLVLNEDGGFNIEFDLETGLEISNIENVARSYNKSLNTHASWQTLENSQMYGVDNFAAYIDARFSLTAFERLKTSAYTRQNTSGIGTTGFSLAYIFHPGKLYELTLRTSVEKIEDAFNRIYRHDIGRSNKSYGLDLELRRRFKN